MFPGKMNSLHSCFHDKGAQHLIYLSDSVRLFSLMSLFTYPGTMEVTFIPNGWSSRAKASVILSTAALLPCKMRRFHDIAKFELDKQLADTIIIASGGQAVYTCNWLFNGSA